VDKKSTIRLKSWFMWEMSQGPLTGACFDWDCGHFVHNPLKTSL